MNLGPTLSPKLHLSLVVFALISFSLACFSGGGTAIPVSRPVDFDVQTATPTLDLKRVTPTVVEEVDIGLLIPLGDAPTHTPNPNALPTLRPLPTNTIPPLISTPTITPTVAEAQATPTETVQAAPPPTPSPVVELDPPLQGGDWAFETDFIPWPNPYGEPCPGAAVASGWIAFVEEGAYGSSCMNENLYQPNVFSGAKSQEMTFDFIAANSGLLRTIPTRPGHRYQITAYAKHDWSISPVEMALGVDLTGGTIWHGETVQWFPWDGQAEDTWNQTEETVIATGESMTIFIKGYHPLAEQGGKTVIDEVSVTHLGP